MSDRPPELNIGPFRLEARRLSNRIEQLHERWTDQGDPAATDVVGLLADARRGAEQVLGCLAAADQIARRG